MDTTQLVTRIVSRNDTELNWETSNPTLLRGEIGIEIDTNKIKIGDGTTAWKALPYAGVDNAQIQALIDAAEDKFYTVVRNEGETDDEAIARALGDHTASQGDMAVVQDLLATDTYQYTAYVYNGTGWAAMSGNYSADNIYFDRDMMVTKEIGYITLTNGQGTIPSNGKNLTEVFEAMFVKEQEPSKTDPSVSVTLTGAGSYEVGTVVSGVKYSASFDDGNYTYGPDPTGATVSAWAVTDTAGGSYTTASGDLADVTVLDSTSFSVTAKATHSEGATPVTNKGNESTDTSKKIAAGTKSKTSSAITGYRSFFYGILTTGTDVALTSEIIRSLTNGGNYNAAKTLDISVNGAAAKRIVVAIPSANTRSGITKVMKTDGLATEITGSYVLTEKAVKVADVRGTVDGVDTNAVDYDVYVYAPASIDAAEVHAITLG